MVRSSNPNEIFRDIHKTLERTVQEDVSEINTKVSKRTPYKTGHASRSWKLGKKYKLGGSMSLIDNKATYIGLLDAGSTPGPTPTINYIAHKGPSRPIASDGIVAPVLKEIINRRRKL